MLVQQILSAKAHQDVVTLPATATLSEAAEMLSSRRIGAVIISPDGTQVAGILSERDIVRELGKRGVGCMIDSVASVMTAKIISCAAGDSADEVLHKMTGGRFRHMPVMEGGQMIGLISIGDVVAARLSELSMEKDALEGMIKGF